MNFSDMQSEEDGGRKANEKALRNVSWSKYLEAEAEAAMRRYDEAMEAIEAASNHTDTTSLAFATAFEKAQNDLDNTSQSYYRLSTANDSPSTSSIDDDVTATLALAHSLETIYNTSCAALEREKSEFTLDAAWEADRVSAKQFLEAGRREVRGSVSSSVMLKDEGLGGGGNGGRVLGLGRGGSKRESGLERALRSMGKGVKRLIRSANEE